MKIYITGSERVSECHLKVHETNLNALFFLLSHKLNKCSCQELYKNVNELLTFGFVYS